MKKISKKFKKNQPLNTFVDISVSLCKIILIGDSSVGKSSFLCQYKNKEFSENIEATIGADFYTKTVRTETQTRKIQVWDTSGQERYRAITRGYYRGSKAVIFMYDITRKPTFDGLEAWINESDEYVDKDYVKLIIGNKKDLTTERQVSTEEATSFAKKHGALFAETSSKTGDNVETAFDHLISEIYKDADTLDKFKSNEQQINDPDNYFITSSTNTIKLQHPDPEYPEWDPNYKKCSC